MSNTIGYDLEGFANSSVTRSQTSPIAAVELSDPVSLYLPFDSDVNDDSDNNHTVTAYGDAAVSSTQAKFGGNSLSLNATDQYLSVAGSTDFDFGTGNFTIEGWIYSERSQSENLLNQGIIYAGGTGGWNVSLGHLTPNTPKNYNTIRLYRYVDGSDNYSINTPQTVTRNAWHHFAVVRENATTIKIYVDGVLSATEDSVAASAEFNSTGSGLEIGRNWSSTNTSNWVNGYIDDLRITKGVARYTTDFIPPSQAVGAKLSGSNETNTTTDFTAFYAPFDSDVNDDSSNAGTGTASGSAAISSTQAKFGGNSLYLPTGNHAVTYPNTTDFDFDDGPFTVEFWAYATATAYGNFESVMGFGSGGSWHVSYVPGDSSNDGGYFEFPGTGGYTGIDGVGQGAAAQWMHIAFTRDDNNVIRYFVNGTIKNSATNNTTSRGSGGNTFKIGYGGVGSYRSFQGYLDDIRIIKGYAKYTADFAPPTSAVGTSVSETVNDLTVLYLPFDDDSMEDQARNHGIIKEGTVALSTSVKKLGTSSAYFAAADDEIQIPGGKFNLGSSFTIEGWYYLTAYTEHSVGFTYDEIGGSSGKDSLVLGLATSDNKVRFQIGLDGGSEYLTPGNDATNTKLSLNTWTHVACVRDGTNLYVFKDGVQQGATVTVSSSSLVLSETSNDHVFIIGGSTHSPSPYSNHGMRGYIDDFRIVDGVALYTSNFTPPTSAVGLAVESGGVTTNTVDNKFLSSVWDSDDITEKMADGTWIRNDESPSGANPAGVVVQGAGLQVDGHRHFIGPGLNPGTPLTITAYGAGGGDSDQFTTDGGAGGYAQLTTSFPDSDTLYVVVGQAGNRPAPSVAPGGRTYGGGGGSRQTSGTHPHQAPGGGFSGVFTSPYSENGSPADTSPTMPSDDVIIIAGGGGGAGEGTGGAGGGEIGQDGQSPTTPQNGGGGTQNAGGSKGYDVSPAGSATPGVFLTGGRASVNEAGGGGGGGYYGGGGGGYEPAPSDDGYAHIGSGGGGSGYVGGATGVPVIDTTNTQGGGSAAEVNGQVTIRNNITEVTTTFNYTGSQQTYTV